jgi:hypothetical protein
MPPVKDRRSASAPLAMSPQTTMSDSSSYHSPESSPTFSSDSVPSSSRLIREKNRLTLRAYLHSLMTSSTIVSSPVLRSFLMSGPTNLSPEELEDAKRREEADQLREEGRKRFAREIASRVEGLRAATKIVQGDIMGQGILSTCDHIFFVPSHSP